jgi:hypothetical protein
MRRAEAQACAPGRLYSRNPPDLLEHRETEGYDGGRMPQNAG